MSMRWEKLTGMWDFRQQQKPKKAIKQLTGTLTVIMRRTQRARCPTRCRNEIEAAHNHMTWKIPVCPNTVTHPVPLFLFFPSLFPFFFLPLTWFYYAHPIQYLVQFRLHITIFVKFSLWGVFFFFFLTVSTFTWLASPDWEKERGSSDPGPGPDSWWTLINRVGPQEWHVGDHNDVRVSNFPHTCRQRCHLSAFALNSN